MRRVFQALIVGSHLLAPCILLADDAADEAFFESKVRPVLIAKCQECHNSDKPKAGLQLDSRDGVITGGESGPVAIPGKPEESLLIEVIGYRNVVQMPPKSKLPDSEIAVLTEWVRRGLPWPNSKPATPAPAASPTAQHEFSDEQKAFWAFQPVRREQPPVPTGDHWVRSPIDRFILSELEAKGLQPSADAGKRTLIRRVTLDLIGLLPTIEEVHDFLADSSPDALEREVDRLLASPRYGERWGRHWLDVARYADSNGLDENLAYANAYRYRDYVIKSIREDKPYDRFVIEQIAGDVLSSTSKSSTPESAAESFDALTATGFLCLGAKMLAEDDPVKMQMDIIDEQVDTIARAVMGLTMGCARCHDHKYDPLSMEDYYGLAGVFKSTQTMDTFTVVARWHERPLATPEQLRHRDELQQLASTQKQLVDKLKNDAVESLLTKARQHAGAYLLAATDEWKLAEQLSVAQPRGNEQSPASIPGALLIEAEDYARGNVLKDLDNYGKGIGVLVNRGEAPNYTEYEIQLDQPCRYQLELRYAAAASRPCKVFVNGRLVKSDAAGKLTGSWTPETQTWFVECFVSLNEGRNLVRLEQPQFFPHIDKLLLTPVDPSTEIASATNTTDSSSTQVSRLIPSITQQWIKALESSKSDPKSILTGWHQFIGKGQLTADPAIPENGVARLLSSSQPASRQELADRYAALFELAQQEWKQLKASEEEKDATSLKYVDLEAARKILTDPKGPYAVPADIETEFSPDLASELKTGREELARREAAIPRFPETMAVSESKPENLKIHLRGSHLTLGKEVPRQLPKILSGNENRILTDTALTEPNNKAVDGDKQPSDATGRLRFARWLASADHPLTSRVMVNRIWQWHFGQGLVRSPDNFGKLGERPSHPALLDWLASEFSGQTRQHQINPQAWSLKTLHRSLISSATYRQRTAHHPDAALLDPENRLLWRSHRQRMDVEVLRDSLLAISGQLNEIPGGTLLPTANRNYVTSTANVNPQIYNSNRRSVYLPVVRSALFEVFTAFDFADPSTLAGQRDQTTVASQALFMMNSSFVLDQVRAIASQLIEKTTDPAERIREIYVRGYSRDPSEAEVSRALAYLERMRTSLTSAEPGIAPADMELRAWVSLSRAVLSANEFLYIE